MSVCCYCFVIVIVASTVCGSALCVCCVLNCNNCDIVRLFTCYMLLVIMSCAFLFGRFVLLVRPGRFCFGVLGCLVVLCC